ncbi:hypothetical protein [Kribbella sp. NPDC051620]|uniref:hypothetical protein n=1 Tax=Kribbella sp. NPDC051620 TaxID=3364120 RepID=UPI0037AFB314
MPDTWKFHLNERLRDDFFMARDLQYEQVTVAKAKAKAMIDAGLEPVDEELMADSLTRWRSEPEQFDPEQVFASVVAGLR